MWTSFIHAFFKHTSSDRDVWLLSLRRLLMNWCSRVSSTAPLCVQVDIRVRGLELSGIRGVSPSFRSCAA